MRAALSLGVWVAVAVAVCCTRAHAMDILVGDNQSLSWYTVRILQLPDAYNAHLHEDAIRKAFTAAAAHWPSKRRLRAAVTYRPLQAGVSAHTTRYVSYRGGVIQSGALAAFTPDFDGQSDDIVIDLHSSAKWHVGDSASQVPSDAYDLSTVVLQEIYHCLMMSGSLPVDDAGSRGWIGNDRTPSRFDAFLSDARRCAVLGRPVAEIGGALTGGKLSFWLPHSAAAVALYAPTIFTSQSIYHLRPRAAQPWRLLEPSVPMGVRRLAPGPELLAMQRAFLNGTLSGAPKCAGAAPDVSFVVPQGSLPPKDTPAATPASDKQRTEQPPAATGSDASRSVKPPTGDPSVRAVSAGMSAPVRSALVGLAAALLVVLGAACIVVPLRRRRNKRHALAQELHGLPPSPPPRAFALAPGDHQSEPADVDPSLTGVCVVPRWAGKRQSFGASLAGFTVVPRSWL